MIVAIATIVFMRSWLRNWRECQRLKAEHCETMRAFTLWEKRSQKRNEKSGRDHSRPPAKSAPPRGDASFSVTASQSTRDRRGT